MFLQETDEEEEPMEVEMMKPDPEILDNPTVRNIRVSSQSDSINEGERMTISSFLDRLSNFFPGRRMEEIESAMTGMKDEEMMAIMNELDQMENM